MDVSETIDHQIAKLNDWREATLANLRRIIHEADPKIIEELKWMGTPVWSHDGIVFLAKAFKDKVKETFPNGASLADPDKVFNAELTGNANIENLSCRILYDLEKDNHASFSLDNSREYLDNSGHLPLIRLVTGIGGSKEIAFSDIIFLNDTSETWPGSLQKSSGVDNRNQSGPAN